MSPHRSRMTRALALASTAALALGGVLLTASPAAAANPDIEVVNELPLVTDIGSLAWAIDKANTDLGADSIVFAIPTPGPWTIPVPLATPLPDIVDALTITGPGSGSLTITTTDGAPTAIYADGCAAPDLTDLTLTGMTFTDFSGIAVDSYCLDLVAQGLVISGSGLYGLAFSGSTGNTAELTSVTADTGNTGIYLSANPGVVITATDLRTANNSNYGLSVDANGGSIDIGDSTSTLNGLDGFGFNPGNGAVIALHGLDSTQNSEYGIYVTANSGSTVTITDSTVSDNDQGNITGEVNSSSLTVSGTTANDSTGAGGIGFDAFGGSDVHIIGSTVAGNANSGVDAHLVGSTLEVSGSTFDSNGFDTLGVVADDGGGFLLWAESASAVTVSDSTFTNNEAGFGGGIEATVDSDSTVDISTSHVNDNHAVDCGCLGSGVGGGLYVIGVNGDDSRFTLTDSEVAGNESLDGGGGLYLEDLGVDFFGTVGPTGGVTVLRTTIDNNHSIGGGYGGGVYVDNWSWKTDPSDPLGSLPAIVFDQSTISSNSAVVGGGIYADKGTDNNVNTGILLLTSTTVSTNDAVALGGGIAMFSTYDDGSLQLSHSTVAANTGGSGFPIGVIYLGSGTLGLDHALLADNGDYDIAAFAPTVIANWSLVENDPISVVTGTGNVIGVDPALAPLANNGGTTKTMLIAPGSAAYNAGNPAFVPPPTTDQRGQARVYQTIDIGAVEWHPTLALTGGGPRPETPLVGMLLLFVGLALIAGSRIRAAA